MNTKLAIMPTLPTLCVCEKLDNLYEFWVLEICSRPAKAKVLKFRMGFYIHNEVNSLLLGLGLNNRIVITSFIGLGVNTPTTSYSSTQPYFHNQLFNAFCWSANQTLCDFFFPSSFLLSVSNHIQKQWKLIY